MRWMPPGGPVQPPGDPAAAGRPSSCRNLPSGPRGAFTCPLSGATSASIPTQYRRDTDVIPKPRSFQNQRVNPWFAENRHKIAPPPRPRSFRTRRWPSTPARSRVVGISFDLRHGGDLLCQVHDHPNAKIAFICDAAPAGIKLPVNIGPWRKRCSDLCGSPGTIRPEQVQTQEPRRAVQAAGVQPPSPPPLLGQASPCAQVMAGCDAPSTFELIQHDLDAAASAIVPLVIADGSAAW